MSTLSAASGGEVSAAPTKNCSLPWYNGPGRASSNSRHIGEAGSTGGRELGTRSATLSMLDRVWAVRASRRGALRRSRWHPFWWARGLLVGRRRTRPRARADAAAVDAGNGLQPARRASRSTSTPRTRPRVQATRWRAAGPHARRRRHGAPRQAPDRGLVRRRPRRRRARARGRPGGPTSRPSARPAGRLPRARPRLRQLLGRRVGLAERLPRLGARRSRAGSARAARRSSSSPTRSPRRWWRTASPPPRKAERYALLADAVRTFARAAQRRASTSTPATRAGSARRGAWSARCARPASRAADGFALNVSNFYRTGTAVALRARALAPAGRRALRDRHEPQRQRAQPPRRRRRPEVVQPARPRDRAQPHHEHRPAQGRRLPVGQAAGRQRRLLPRRRAAGRATGGPSTRCSWCATSARRTLRRWT